MVRIQELLLSFEGDETVGASRDDIRFFHQNMLLFKKKKKEKEKKIKEGKGGGERVRALQSPLALARYHAFDLGV